VSRIAIAAAAGAASVLALTGTAAAVSQNERMAADATAELTDARGRRIGTVQFSESARGVIARIEATGLTPGWHGVHFHERGRCEGPGFQSAQGHVHHLRAPVVHGLMNPRGNDAGDLPNIHAGPGGRAKAEVFSPFVTLRAVGGRTRLLDADGAALMIHAMADDHRSQPIGGSGDRVACGVIRASRR